MDAVHQLGEASVADVRKQLANPPSYTSVRTMMRLLEEKGLLKHRREGMRYVYRSAESPERVKRSAVKHLMKTFFSSSPSDAVAAVLDASADKMSPEDFDRLTKLIENARKEGR
jgi:BlaI family transcriptional regulator, penicillinase repressor